MCVCIANVIMCCGYVDEATGDGVSPQHLFRNRRGRMIDANTHKQQRTHTDTDNEQTVVVVLPPRLISAHLAPKAQVYADISNPHMFPHPHTHTHTNADTVGTHTLAHTQTHTQTGTYTLASAPTLLQYTRRWLLRTREHKRLRTLFRTVRGLRTHTLFVHTWRRVFTEHRQWRLCVCRRAFTHMVACLRTHIRGKQRAAQAYRLLQCGRALQKLFVNAQLHTHRHTQVHTHKQRSSQVDSRHTQARTQTHTPAHTQSRVVSKSDVGVVGKLLDSMQSAAHASKFAALLQFHANRLSAPSGAHTHSTMHSSTHSATMHTTRQTAGTPANTHTGTRQQQQPSRRAHTQSHTQTHTQSKPGRHSYGDRDSEADGDDYEEDFVNDDDGVTTSTFARTHSSPGTQQTHIGSGSTTPMFARRRASGRGGTTANTSSMMTMDDLDNTSTIASITSASASVTHTQHTQQHRHQHMRRGGGLSAHTSSSTNSSSNSNSMGPAQQADNANDEGPMSILDSYCLFNRLKAALYRLHTHARLRTHIHAALTHVETHHLTSALHHWQTWSTEHKQTRILHTKRLSHSFEHWKMCVVHKKHTLAFKRRWFVYMKSRRLGGVLLK
jgi:hypothetical protein